MNANLSIAHLIAQASVLVQIIMGLLMLASVVSWAVIISKQRLLKRTRQASEKFEERFWSGGNLSDLYDSVTRNKEADGLIPISEQAHGRCNQSLGDTRRNHSQAGLLHITDADEGIHDAPHGTEQADIGAG